MSDKEKIKLIIICVFIVLFFVFFTFIEVYGWRHPEKTGRQITLDFFEGKIFREFS